MSWLCDIIVSSACAKLWHGNKNLRIATQQANWSIEIRKRLTVNSMQVALHSSAKFCLDYQAGHGTRSRPKPFMWIYSLEWRTSKTMLCRCFAMMRAVFIQLTQIHGLCSLFIGTFTWPACLRSSLGTWWNVCLASFVSRLL